METIAALSTAVGRAAVAVVRVSGDGVPDVARALFRSTLEPRRPTLAWLRHPETGDGLDRVLVTFFPGPRSYTGEDLLEISCHGGLLNPQLVLEAVQAAGTRPAQPGEFTRRAFLNGKLDLLQAEAVLDLIDGRSPALHSAAVDQLDRGLSRRIERLREAIVNCEALLVYEIDFPEEDEGPVPAGEVEAAAREILARIDGLLDTAAEGELLREGALTVIAGRPNAGKSSLFNALCGFERAIVTEQPGTTRDALEAVVTLSGFPFRLVDTAGLREAEGTVETLGIEVARRYLAGADVVLFCVEAGRPLGEDEQGFMRELPPDRLTLVRTKSDLENGEAPASHSTEERSVAVSARTGDGLAALRETLVSMAFSGLTGAGAEAPLVTRKRHVRHLRQARQEVETFLDVRARSLAPEVTATHLRSAAAALEELLGVVTPEDLLARVFSEFCIGK